jgi:hypothetical protein
MNMSTKKATPMKEHEVPSNPDPHIDQDFKGFPHPPANKKNITPKTETEKLSAGIKKKANKKTYGG